MNWRIVIAFLVAPALCPLAMQAFLRLTQSPDHIEPASIDQMLTLGTSYVIALLAGIPLHEYLQRKGWVRLSHYVIAGGVVGAVPGVALAMSANWFPRTAALAPILSAISMGALTAAAFWFIGIYSRERDEA
jgi:hypothetical protein